MNNSGMGAWSFYSWPGEEIGFMDRDVGINVAYSKKLEGLDKEDREKKRQKLIEEISDATSPYEDAGTLRIDEIIQLSETRIRLAKDLAKLANGKIPAPEQRPLSYWQTC